MDRLQHELVGAAGQTVQAGPGQLRRGVQQQSSGDYKFNNKKNIYFCHKIVHPCLLAGSLRPGGRGFNLTSRAPNIRELHLVTYVRTECQQQNAITFVVSLCNIHFKPCLILARRK